MISASAMFLYPLIAPALERPWTQSETFGITPDPTAIATLGILLLVNLSLSAGSFQRSPCSGV